MNRLAYALCCSILFTGIDSASAQQKPAKYQAPTIPAIDAAMQSFVESVEISGAVTLVSHEGKLIHLGSVGMSKIDSDVEMQTHTLFSIASMTKPITATALMILQDEEKLSIDDKLSKYIPEFSSVKLTDGNAPNRELTIRDAITHTSGLSGSQIFSSTLEDSVIELAKRPLDFEPGSKWKYSPGMNVAGHIVEIVSGQPLQNFMKERIFEPLDMKNTTFFPNERQARRIATLYQPSEDKTSLVAAENHITSPKSTIAANPSGGLISSARDMFRFYQMVLNGGQFRKTRILSKDAVAAMTFPQTGDLETGFTPGNCWGLGWCIVREPQGVTESLSPGTFGHGGAFGTQGWVDPETKTIYVLMIQRTKMGNSDGSEIRKVFQNTASNSLNL